MAEDAIFEFVADRAPNQSSRGVGALAGGGRSAAPQNFGDRRVSFLDGPRSIQNKPLDRNRARKRAQSDEAASGAPASNAPPEPAPPFAPAARSIGLVDI